MSSNADSADAEESSVETANERPTFERRPLLRALGVGATLSLGTGVATGQSDAPEIDPFYGYSVRDANEVPEGLRPDHEVDLTDARPVPEAELLPLFVFDPVGLQVRSGDVVQFTFSTPDHTVTAYHEAVGFGRRIPEDVPPFSSPILPVGGAWLYRFDREGVYDLYCGPHHVLGMVMRIVVGDLDEADYPDYLTTPEGIPPFGEEFEGLLVEFSDENDAVEWVFPTPRAVLTADALDPARIREDGEVPYSAVRRELAGADGETTTR